MANGTYRSISPNLAKVMAAYDQESLRAVLEMRESRFEKAYGMERVQVDQVAPADFYLFLDRGASVLAVAHLDTVASPGARRARFVRSEAGSVVFSRALDDRLGAYTILEMLPLLGINVDVLLTTGEESGQSTASYFETDKSYRWVIEFDRGGTDVVMYQYDDFATATLVRECGATVGRGSFSDIAYLEHLNVKCFNWGIGYGPTGGGYHGPRAHAFLADMFGMVAQFMRFWETNKDVHLPHKTKPVVSIWSGKTSQTYDEWLESRSGDRDDHGVYRNRKNRDWWQDANSPGNYTRPVTHSQACICDSCLAALDDAHDNPYTGVVLGPSSSSSSSSREISLRDMTDDELEAVIARYADQPGT